tara:strand:- start:9793 stop:11364 length:1572 start_codon:yes stop_codon:yes gene_type:complete
MSDVFSQLDEQQSQRALADYINAINARERDENKVRVENAEQKEKDDEYNSKVEGVTDPIAQELLRKPIEDLSKTAIKNTLNAFKARANRSLNSLGRKGVDYLKKSVLDKANEFGIEPEKLKGLLSDVDPSKSLADTQDQLFTKLKGLADPEKLNQLATQATPSTEVDPATNQITNAGKIEGQGNIKPPADKVATEPDEFGEAKEIDPFTGNEIQRGKPLFDLDSEAKFDDGEPEEFDDWTTSLYDNPITHSSAPPDVTAPPAEAPAPVEVEAPENPFSFSNFQSGSGAFGDAPKPSTSSRLSSIFQDSNLDNAPSVDFTGKSLRVPQPKALSADSVAGDAEPLDQLAPMRDLLKGRGAGGDAVPQFTRAQNQQVLRDFQRTATDPPPSASAQSVNRPLTEDKTLTPESGQPPPKPTPEDDQVGPNAGDTRPPPKPSAIEGDADDVAKQSGESALKSAGEDALEEGGDIMLAGGGPEDPITDVIGLVAGLGTLLGGLFGGHHTKPMPPTVDATPVNPTYQSGVS